MIKPTMPNMPNMPHIPGMEAMTDTLDFVKNLWGSMGIPGTTMPNMNIPGMNIAGMNIPGMVIPTLSVDEIGKRISELKAVESWLTLNMGMLRSTIQALEVQAATLGTLQSMSESFAASMNPSARERQPEPSPSASASSSNGAGSSNGARSGNGSHHAPEPTSRDESDAAALTAPLVNAAAWWNMLQDQFKQAVNTAMNEVPNMAAAATGTPAEKPKAKSTKKAAPAASTTATRKRKTSK
jgi:hypothetical protein